MTNGQPEPINSFLLPRLKADCDVRPVAEQGVWDCQSSSAFASIASSLEYDAPSTVANINSVPTIWARPISFELALHNNQYPIHEEAVASWQGMLAAIALKEYQRLPLSAKLLNLSEPKLRTEMFGRALYELCPSSSKALYTFPNNRNPWEEVYIFLWDGKPVGMTSPSTIVVPTESEYWSNLGWFDRKKQQLGSPIGYLHEKESVLLWRWIENLRGILATHNGRPGATNQISRLLSEFQSKLNDAPPEESLSLSDDPQSFGVPLNRGVLIGLNRPIKAPPQPSNVRLIASNPDRAANKKPLLILDPNIAHEWNHPPSAVFVHNGQTLATLNLAALRSRNLVWDDVEYLEPQDLFLPRLYAVEGENVFPGAIMPREVEPLRYDGERITPLLPLNPILLNYLTPDDLIRRVQLQTVAGDFGPCIRVIVDLPLTGLSGDEKQPSNYRLFKDYPLEVDTILEEIPVLEVWPNFKMAGWKSYYTFYSDINAGDETFQVSFPLAWDRYTVSEGQGIFQLSYLEEFPEYIECQNSKAEKIGLIVLPVPRTIQASGEWIVGVDFGTSFTNVYYATSRGTVQPLPLPNSPTSNLHHQVTDSDPGTRLPLLFDRFIPQSFVPLDKPLPLASILTTQSAERPNGENVRPILDGRICVTEQSEKFNPAINYIHSNLKWTTQQDQLPYRVLFLKHLALQISAIAANNAVSQIQWAFSYPSAFSTRDVRSYAGLWEDLMPELEMKTGIKHSFSAGDNQENLKTESLAVAQYFADEERQTLSYTTCIDIGGGSSDISIWEANVLIHQCSVQLAGRDLFSSLLEGNPTFIEKYFVTHEQDSSWRGLKGATFAAKLDTWLRLEGETWLRGVMIDNNRKMGRFISATNNKDFQGLQRLLAIGISGLYYYVGILLKTLHAEQDENGNPRFSAGKITSVYLGGNGSRFLNWLDSKGEFNPSLSEINSLLSYVMSQGSGWPDTRESTILSRKLKDEVACGLVLRDTKLRGLNKKKDDLIAGEAYRLNGQSMPATSRMRTASQEPIRDVAIAELEELPKFLKVFHDGLQELEIELFSSLPGYQPNLELAANARLWEDVKKEVDALLLKQMGNQSAETLRLEPPFIVGLKGLLRVLSKQWQRQ